MIVYLSLNGAFVLIDAVYLVFFLKGMHSVEKKKKKRDQFE